MREDFNLVAYARKKKNTILLKQINESYAYAQ